MTNRHARALGRIRTPRKALAARRNARLGGRPPRIWSPDGRSIRQVLADLRATIARGGDTSQSGQIALSDGGSLRWGPDRVARRYDRRGYVVGRAVRL